MLGKEECQACQGKLRGVKGGVVKASEDEGKTAVGLPDGRVGVRKGCR